MPLHITTSRFLLLRLCTEKTFDLQTLSSPRCRVGAGCPPRRFYGSNATGYTDGTNRSCLLQPSPVLLDLCPFSRSHAPIPLRLCGERCFRVVRVLRGPCSFAGHNRNIIERSFPIDDHSHALTSTDAQSGEAETRASVSHDMEQRD